MPTSPTPELHGIEGQIFAGFDGETRYRERVTVVYKHDAEILFANEYGVDVEDVDPQPIHMRWVTDGNDPELEDNPVPDVPCWLECDADHPDAVPFWKDAP